MEDYTKLENKKLFKKKKNPYYVTVGELMKALEKCDKNDAVILTDREWGASPLDMIIYSNLVYVPEDEQVGDVYLKEPEACSCFEVLDSSIEDDTGLGIVNAIYLECK